MNLKVAGVGGTSEALKREDEFRGERATDDDDDDDYDDDDDGDHEDDEVVVVMMVMVVVVVETPTPALHARNLSVSRG